MRILVFSDSHGDSESINKVMRRFYPDAALHLGDGAGDLLAQIILFGNTHTPALFVSHGITFMNPGSIGRDFSFQTFGVIDIFENEYFCEVQLA